MLARIVYPSQSLFSRCRRGSLSLSHCIRRSLATRRVLITAALPYVNNAPHLGNLIGSLLSADCYARYCRMSRYEVLFVSGSDEYGTATEVQAHKLKMLPRQLCDSNYQTHKKVYEWFSISTDTFGRTSTPTHTQITQEVFGELHKQGFIGKGEMTTFHCSNCALTLADRFVNGLCKYCNSPARADQCDSCSMIFDNPTEELIEPRCSLCNQTPQPQTTSHLFLELPSMTAKLLKWLQNDTKADFWTKAAISMTRGLLNNGLMKRCITRNLKWGVPVPLAGYQSQVFYVWFEATLGYISITKELLGDKYKQWWHQSPQKPVQLHQFMGKDNISFHSIMSPAALLHSGQPWVLPSVIDATQFLTFQGKKFSKSQNIGIFAEECLTSNIPADSWRYYLLRIRPEKFDTSFDFEDFKAKIKDQFFHNICNYINRSNSLAISRNKIKPDGINVDQFSEAERNLLNELEQSWNNYVLCMENHKLAAAAKEVANVGNAANRYITERKVWKITHCRLQIGVLLRASRLIGVMLYPFTPDTSSKVAISLGLAADDFDIIEQLKVNFKDSFMECLRKSKGIVPIGTIFQPDFNARLDSFQKQKQTGKR